VGRATTAAEVDEAADLLIAAARRLAARRLAAQRQGLMEADKEKA
jgi:hypothetical protein